MGRNGIGFLLTSFAPEGDLDALRVTGALVEDATVLEGRNVEMERDGGLGVGRILHAV